MHCLLSFLGRNGLIGRAVRQSSSELCLHAHTVTCALMICMSALTYPSTCFDIDGVTYFRRWLEQLGQLETGLTGLIKI